MNIMFSLLILIFASSISAILVCNIAQSNARVIYVVIKLIIICILFLGSAIIATNWECIISMEYILYVISTLSVIYITFFLYKYYNGLLPIIFLIFAPILSLFIGYSIIGPLPIPTAIISFLIDISKRFGADEPSIEFFIKALIVISAFLYLGSPSRYLMEALLGKYKIIGTIKIDSGFSKCGIDEKERGRGALIGILERWLIFPLVLLNQYTAIAFILTAKTVVRHKEFDNRDFAEYFIIGTLSSVATALFVGVIAGKIIKTI